MLIHNLLDFHAGSRGDGVMAVFGEQSMTFAEAKLRSVRLAAALQRLGVKRGDRLSVLMLNSIDILIVFYAASRLGAVAVPLNCRLATQECRDLIIDSQSLALIADEQFRPGFEGVEFPAGFIKIVAGEATQGWASLQALIEDAPDKAEFDGPSADDVAFQMYTSGTTGRAKGALLTHLSFLSSVIQSNFATPHKISPGEKTLLTLPLFHIAAIYNAFSVISSGATLVIHRQVNALEIARSLAEDDIVSVGMVPSVIQFLLTQVPGIEQMTFPSLKLVSYGASPIAAPVLQRAMEVFKCNFAQGFGMTELSGICSLLTESDHRRALAGRPDLLLSTGKALPDTQIRIVGPDDAPLPPGEVGEIVIRGPQVMKGYWNMPEATAETLRGGWLHTGDAGYLDEEGYLFIRDRIKDMIVSGGENVYPAEVESVLHRHPGVAQAAVIGVPDDRWGETVMAVIVPAKSGAPTEAELDVLCRAHLGAFKVPRRYEFVNELPLNASGKILKRELRTRFWSGQERSIA